MKCLFNQSSATIEKFLLPENRGVSWTVSEGERFYVVSDEHLYVKGFADGSVERQARRAQVSRKPNTSEALLWTRSKSILKRVDAKSKLTPWKLLWQKVDPNLRSYSSIVSCNFSQKAYGIDSAGVGNFLSVSFDSQSGRISSLTHSRNWKYDKPNVKIKSDRAIAVAESIGRNRFKASVNFKSINYTYLMPMSRSGDKISNKFRKERRLRVGYVVAFDVGEVYLDAETGKSLGEKHTRKQPK